MIRYQHFFSVVNAKDEYIATLYASVRGDVLWFTSLWVHADHRKRGLGTQLLSEGIRALGHQVIYLQVMGYTDQPLSDEQLTTWYGRFDFHPTAVPCILRRLPGPLEMMTPALPVPMPKIVDYGPPRGGWGPV